MPNFHRSAQTPSPAQKYNQLLAIIIIFQKITDRHQMLDNFLIPSQATPQPIKNIASSSQQQQISCMLCTGPSLTPIISHALYQKYSQSQDFLQTKYLNDIIQQPERGVCTHEVAVFKEFQYMDNEHQEMRRMYSERQFENKIAMISEYYKFHRDVPMCFDRPISKILERYYGKVRECDYRRIKNVLKEQQGISLTTQKSDSSFEDDSRFQKKSRYSTMLNGLDSEESREESKLLIEMCDKIDRTCGSKSIKSNNVFDNLKKSNQENFQLNIKEKYESGEKAFQSFIQKEKIKNCKLQGPRIYKSGKNINEIRGLGSSNEVERGFKKPPIRTVAVWGKSIEKTTANQTISREEKSKNNQKNRIMQIQIGNKKSNSSQGERKSVLRPLISNLIEIQSTNKVKTIEEIYKKSRTSTVDKYQSDKSRKSTSTISTTINKRRLSLNSCSKLPSYASKELKFDFKTIEVAESRHKSININRNRPLNNDHFTRENLHLANSRSTRGVSLTKQSRSSLKKNLAVRRKSTAGSDHMALQTASSKQLSRAPIQYECRTRITSRYQSADLKTRNIAIKRLLESKLEIFKRRKV